MGLKVDVCAFFTVTVTVAVTLLICSIKSDFTLTKLDFTLIKLDFTP